MSIDYEALAAIGSYGFRISWKVQFVKSDNGVFYDSRYTGVCEAATEDDAYAVGRFLVNQAEKCLISNYEITIHERFMRKWIYSWDSSKERVSPPDHRVFIYMGGTDCDGVSWCQYYSFKTLDEATEYVNGSLAYADGPTTYSTMSRDDWEMAGYPEFRDPYAEAAGY